MTKNEVKITVGSSISLSGYNLDHVHDDERGWVRGSVKKVSLLLWEYKSSNLFNDYGKKILKYYNNSTDIVP